MKKVAIILYALILGGCVNLKIKSELPKIDLYSLNTHSLVSSKCQGYKDIALIGIESSTLYDTKDILIHSDDGKIQSMEGKKWVDFPKNMLKDLLAQEASKQCILISLPPFGTSLPQKMLKLMILSFGIFTDKQPQAQLGLGYEIFIGGKKVDSGILINKKDTQGNPIQALQEVSKMGIDKVSELFSKQK
ncbi:hypothetical protein [Helicobacter sp. 11S03491-1]|uniref:hypothetical protein n=1 Tax=Helicobacter sp. 11S03491-1 TaxID=1476196 RepID=UPI000BA517DE|nr:hypothetical protein [Helicobacter sp. 11S03491-1]PAF43357.1 hypothetical protein BKH45_01580 [Helicobacter sp. 11S03491-1]